MSHLPHPLSHDELVGCDTPDCHPISAVSGLQAALDGKAASDHSHPGGSASWGGIGGTLSEQTDLQAALDAKAASGHNHDAAYSASGHGHDATYEPKNANIQAHVTEAHAPSNAQKNADITKAEIEAKLTGEISSHFHAGGGADPWTYQRLSADFTASSTTAADINNGALFGFTPAANTDYIWEAVLGIRTATAATNPRLGFAWATGMEDGVCSIEQTSTATAKVMANGHPGVTLLVAVGGLPNNTTSWPAICYGMVRSGATPSGSCRMQLASESNGTVVRVVAAISYFRYRTVP